MSEVPLYKVSYFVTEWSRHEVGLVTSSWRASARGYEPSRVVSPEALNPNRYKVSYFVTDAGRTQIAAGSRTGASPYAHIYIDRYR